jgi:Mrp family chromosome partitioning ATPase
VTTLAQQFEMLLRRRQELTAKILVVQSDVSLLAVASPPDRPASLHPLLIVPPAAILFAVLGCVLAVVLNGLDRTLHSEADAMDALRIPCVGLVPAIPREQIRQLQNVLGQPASPYARALRSILVSILVADPTSPRSQKVILVSSSIGGEGKTALAWSLALCVARLGRRTLLLDFGEFSGRRGHERGSLLNMLTHDLPPAEVVEPIPDFGIDYLPAGLSDGNRLRILANPKISPLLRQLSGAYDFVIIDGPSLLEAPEAKLLASRADHVLFAVHCGSTSREIAQTALHQLAPVDHLDPVRDTRLSSVLTRADPSQHDQFGRRAERLLRRVWPRQPAVKGGNETEGGWTAAIAVKGSGAPNQKSG